MHHDPAVTDVLAHRDVPCPSCGYNLRGLRGEACPECGAAVTWDVLLTPRGRVGTAWVLGLVLLCVALPEAYLKWQRLAYRGKVFYGEQRWSAGTYDQPEATLANPWFAGSTLWWFGVPVMAALWVLLRRRFDARPAWQRWALVAAVAVLVMLGHRRLMFWYYWLVDGYSPWPHWFLDSAPAWWPW